MSKYTCINNRFKKDDKRISKEEVLKLLNKEQFNALVKNGKYSTRDKKESQAPKTQKISMKKVRQQQLSEATSTSNITTKNIGKTQDKCEPKKEIIPPTKKELKEAEKIKDLYKVEFHRYPNKGEVYEVWRYNQRFGYYNFAIYIDKDTPEDLILGIVQDMRNQKEEANKKVITFF